MAKRKVAVLGGGIGALTAAYFLSSKPGWQDEYEITVHTLGWRLGGKCASSRDPARSLRIEEHGLHVWFGFYENAFAMLRACYAELDRPAGTPLASFDQAFTPRSHISMLEDHDGRWSIWPIPFPRKSSQPGVGEDEHEVWTALGEALAFLERQVEHLLGAAGTARPPRVGLPDWAASLVAGAEGHALALARQLAGALPADHRQHEPHHHALIAGLLREFRDWLRGETAALLDAHPLLRRTWEIVDLVSSVIIGCFADEVFARGLRSLDHLDFRAWVLAHGATRATAYSTPVRALYDCMFCYHDGDLERPDFAAGAALGSFIRIGLIYRGDALYEMNAGMGDVVIMPLYQLLARRGVKFEFFSRVRRLELDAARRRIRRVHIGRQVRLKQGSYEPVAWSESLKMPYWPPHPHYEQIVEGETLERRGIDLESHWADWADVAEHTLEIGPEDQVVLGISKGALDGLVDELSAASDAWREMMAQLPSTQTQAMQLWLRRPTEAIGWKGAAPGTMVAGPEPQDVWADMSHLLAAEHWSGDAAPRALQYMCGPYQGDWLRRPPSDHAVPDEALAQVRATAARWLESYAGVLWPDSVDPASGEFDWSVLFDPEDRDGPARLAAQWLRANIDPSERYVLAPAGANLTRLPSDATGFDNLVLAGDWTRNPINSGCVEGAVMSAMAASRALCGYPRRIRGEHFLQG